MPRILIPTPLRQYAGNQSEVELNGSTVAELLDALSHRHGELRRHLYGDQGKLRSFVNVYVNDEDIRHLDKEATPVGADDTISIVPSIAGGAAARAGGGAASAGGSTASDGGATASAGGATASAGGAAASAGGGAAPDGGSTALAGGATAPAGCATAPAGGATVPDGEEPAAAGGAAAPGETASLSREEILRYSRHLIIPEVGMEGQLKLKQAKVLLIGAGGLGAPLGLYLAAAGVGRIGLVDFDVVDFTNLQRQVIHSTADVGRKKVDSAIDSMRGVNPNVRIDRFDTALTSENALEILKDYDIVVDGTDNFPTRYLVNDACVLLGKPNVYGSIFRFEGQASVFATQGGPCYRCLYPEPPPPGLVPSCAEGGVFGILPGLIGLVQATEAVKLIIGIGEPLVGRLLLYDALTMRFRELKLRRDPDCPVCGDHPTVRQPIDYHQFCGVPSGGQAQAGAKEGQMDVTELKAKIDRGDRFTLVDVREPHEYRICRIPGSVPIPLGELAKRAGELDRAGEIVVHCKSGGRSAKAVELLKKVGFGNVSNLAGGILAWSDKVDPRVPKY